MALKYSPSIVRDGLVMCLDASQNKSYPTTDLPVKDGLVMWMDAADDSTFSYSTGTTVSQWRDKSGLNYHMVPKSSGPTRNAFLNSRKVLAFTTSQTIGNNTINLASSANTVFVVSRLTGTTNGRVLTCNLDASGNNWLLGHHGGTYNDYFAEGWVTDGGSLDTNWRMYMGDWSGTSTDLANFYSNGTAITTNSTAASQGPNKLGVNYYSNELSTCEVAEIIVYNKVLSSAERRSVHTYLGQKWGILNTDRSIIDLSGFNDNGLLGNGSTSNMPLFDYYNKGAFKFYASNKYIKLGNNTTINQFAGDFTISLWAMATAENSNWGNLIGDYYTTGVATNNEWQIMMNNSSAGLNVYRVGTGNVINNTASGFSANTWINVVLTRVGSAVSLYANNTVIATATNSSVFGSATGSVNIGIDGNNAAEPFSGLISNVLIYQKGLSAAEVAQNYQAQKSKFDNTIVQQGLILNLDADNPYSYAGAGTTWYDVSGNGYQATMSNLTSANWVSYNGVRTFETNDTNDQGFRITSFPFPASRTYEIWINSKSFSLGWQTWFDDGGGERILFGTSTNTVHVYPDLNFTANLTTGTWYQLVYTLANGAGSACIAYVNGVSIGSGTYNSTIATSGTLYILGDFSGEVTSCYCALARIYNRALSAAEVLQNYNATKGRFGL